MWVEPNAWLLLLAFLVWRRGIKQFPAFLAFALVAPFVQWAMYFADIAPSVDATNFWRMDWASLVVEGSLKFVLVGEIFGNVFGSYPAVARLGRSLIRGGGIVLVLAAAVAAGFAPKDSLFGIVSGAHLLEQTIFLVESGLLVLIFAFSSYFHISWGRQIFGIALGLGISSCVHLATWAAMANGGLADSTRYRLDFVNMATYNLSILIWYYYLLVPRKIQTKPKPRPSEPPADPLAGPSVEEHLDEWNRELERLLQ